MCVSCELDLKYSAVVAAIRVPLRLPEGQDGHHSRPPSALRPVDKNRGTFDIQTLTGQNTLPLSAVLQAVVAWSLASASQQDADTKESLPGQVVCKQCSCSSVLRRPNVAVDTNSVHCGRISQAWSGLGPSSQALW